MSGAPVPTPEDGRTFVIAEAGVNHNGDLDAAVELCEAAAQAGADAVKFQSFSADALVALDAPKAPYQLRETDPEQSSHAMLLALELDEQQHHLLSRRCAELGIEFMSTPFDAQALGMLVDRLGVRRVKVGSGDLTNGPLLLAAARTGLPLIVSTGMAVLAEVREALAVVRWGRERSGEPTPDGLRELAAAGTVELAGSVTLLHCTTDYPAAPGDVNLRALDTLRDAFGLPVGYSDHTLGTAVAVAAVARGATVVEKHLTLDRELPGPDHRASLEPAEFGELVAQLRQVEQALGRAEKAPTSNELANMPMARRSVVAARAIAAGTVIQVEDLDARRPATGLSPLRTWELVGRTAQRDYAPGEQVQL